ncbi:MAG: prolyl oligopeptidase family serine peptidase [Gemmatimonadaceae bacterium]|nr:prolyl oligopeptidase family serine peptidase [Gemmatimonadaceae bacterium]
MYALRSLTRAVGVAAALAFPLSAQQNGSDVATKVAALQTLLSTEGYVQPPTTMAKLVTAPRQTVVALSNLSPDRSRYMREVSEGLPSVQTFGKAHVYFAGLQVDPKANRARSLTTSRTVGLELIDATSGKRSVIETPKGASVSSAAWSPDGKQIAYIANFDAASFVYVADVATGKSVQASKAPLLATLVTSVDWTADGKSLVAVMIPDARKPEPKRPEIATGPLVRNWTDGVKAPERNYASLLEEPYDAELMAWHITGQLAMVDLKTKAVRKIGAPAMIQSVDASPDGQYFRVTTMQTPFSYVVPYSNFGTTEALWDASGKVLSTIQSRGVRFANDTGGRTPAKKGLAWMPQGAGMMYIVADSARGDSARTGGAAPSAAPAGAAARFGGAGGAAGRPERVIKWMPPFGANDTATIYRHTSTIASVLFSDDAKMLFVATSAAGAGEIFAVNLADPTKRMTVLRQRNWTPGFLGSRPAFGFGGGGGGRGGADDTLAFYSNPGQMLAMRGKNGVDVAMLSSDGAVYFRGTQYSRDYLKNPPREFLDKVVVATGAKSRVVETAATGGESLGQLLDADATKIVVTRESPTAVPDAFLRDLKAGSTTKLTSNADPHPEYTALQRRRVTVTRADGIKFIVNVTLPADYKDGTRLPGMLWFYPYEYTDQAGYDRTLRTENTQRFRLAGPRSIEFLATQGYAVANFDPPIIGEQGRMNDNYVSDLRMNLYAVIEELDKQGFIDRGRLGLGGHSYGAFSTVNAMVHTPFFKAGIAGDGMYNRTLTPNGFQSERRDLWSGQRTYLDMSPMLEADKMQGALLMYHSIEDQNVGTDPVSSIRMMQALRALGKTASLFMYPYEDHGPATRETILDQQARWVSWLDLYVKYAGQWTPKKGAALVQ